MRRKRMKRYNPRRQARKRRRINLKQRDERQLRQLTGMYDDLMNEYDKIQDSDRKIQGIIKSISRVTGMRLAPPVLNQNYLGDIVVISAILDEIFEK